MEHPLLLILGGEDFRTPELERALQIKGWLTKWVDPALAGGQGTSEDALEPSALVVNSGRGDASIRMIRDFRSKLPLLPLILVGKNAAGFSMSVDAYIPHGAAPDAWIAALKPFWPTAFPQEEPMAEEFEVFGKYKLLEKVASGGMADIYKAEQLEPPGFNRILALKRLLPKHQQDPMFIQMLFDEASLAVHLSHQNIAHVYDLGTESGTYYIAMEYVDGGNLHELISNAIKLGIAFPEPIAAFIIIQVAEALDYAHRKRDREGNALNLVHRDISPHNILINKKGTVKLIDFGVANAANKVPVQSGGVKIYGKLLYMSPEQSKGTLLDHRSDIFSLGLVLFEMLTSQHCYKGDDEFGLTENVRNGAVRDIRKVKPDISKPMARIIEKALQKNFSSRYQSAHNLALDLIAYLDHLGLESLENDVMAFVKMLHASQPQAKAFAASRFPPVKSNTELHSEMANAPAIKMKAVKKTERPRWIWPTLNALLVLLAWLVWVSMNA
jgi:serine/threonine protein kinase